MKIAQPDSDPSATPEASLHTSRRLRITVLAVSAALLCSGATSCTKTQIGLSIAAIAAVVVGTTVGVTLAVQNQRHTLQGCVFSGPGGVELRTSDSKIYALEGSAATLKVGDRLKLHGSKLKKTKDSTGNQVFVVEKLSRDYGPCPAGIAAPATPGQ
jgi:surface antigen